MKYELGEVTMKFNKEDIYPITFLIVGVISLIYVIVKIVEWVG